MTKPRVIGIAGFLLLRGTLTVLLTLISVINGPAVSTAPMPSWHTPLLYLELILGIGSGIAAIFIWRYRKMGLYLGGIVSVMDVLVFIALILWQYASLVDTIVGLGFVAAILYLIYRYLTKEPEKLAFT